MSNLIQDNFSLFAKKEQGETRSKSFQEPLKIVPKMNKLPQPTIFHPIPTKGCVFPPRSDVCYEKTSNLGNSVTSRCSRSTPNPSNQALSSYTVMIHCDFPIICYSTNLNFKSRRVCLNSHARGFPRNLLTSAVVDIVVIIGIISIVIIVIAVGW